MTNLYINMHKFCAFILINTLIISIYLVITSLPFTTLGGLRPELLTLELPIIIIASGLLYFPKPAVLPQSLLISGLILILYVAYDIFYEFLWRSPSTSDFLNFTVGLRLPLAYSAIVATIATVVIVLCLLLFRLGYQSMNTRHFMMHVSAKVLTIVVLFACINSDAFYRFFNQQQFQLKEWTTKGTIKTNGKFASFIYYSLAEKHNNRALAEATPAPLHESLYKGTIAQKRNVHIVVLESFIDPRLIKDVTFSRTPIAQNMLPFLPPDKLFSLIQNPVYGGGTAQSEFEILTGIPALARLGSTEFNSLRGFTNAGFINQLVHQGYESLATIATDPHYYNSISAYTSMGFKDLHFAADINDVQHIEEDDEIFDGTVLSFTLAQIKQKLSSHQPLVTYTLGMYGHIPFARNLPLRPDVIEVVHTNAKLHNIANQFYYRTKALGQFLATLQQIDANAIIMVVSDHLPPILNNNAQYHYHRKMNIGLLINAGETIPFEITTLYQLPWQIWSLLTHQPPARFSAKELEQHYYAIMAESMGLVMQNRKGL